ncbi:MAG: response regulator [Bacteroidetes bacterium]|nr:response regulator [Bacteroidota bacterium]
MTKYQTVLLIEDDEVDVLNVKRAFRKKGFTQTLLLAENGLDALQKYKGEELNPQPDVILLDLNMPKMGGFEFLKRRSEEGFFADVDVYVMSTSSAESDIKRAEELGANGYVVKPLYTDRFADELEKILGE